jgi:hypothetical protein
MQPGRFIVITDGLVQALTREVRNAIGIERTPSQVRTWLQANVKLVSDRFIRKILDDREALLVVANKMRIPYVDDAPPSSEWGD